MVCLFFIFVLLSMIATVASSASCYCTAKCVANCVSTPLLGVEGYSSTSGQYCCYAQSVGFTGGSCEASCSCSYNGYTKICSMMIYATDDQCSSTSYTHPSTCYAANGKTGDCNYPSVSLPLVMVNATCGAT